MQSRFFRSFALILTLASGPALAQSSPGFSYGQVPTAGQWNAAFATKQDRLTFTPLNRAGGTMTGKLNTAPATINGAGFSILPGIGPSSPVNGDVWVTNSGFFAQVNGQTVSIQNQASVAITGGSINGTAIGGTTPAAGSFTTLSATSLTGLTAPLSAGQGGTGYTGVSAALDGLFSSTQGALLYRGATGWAGLPPGSAGQYLATGGAAANPSWSTPLSITGTPAAGQLAQFASASSLQGLAGALSVALGGTGSTTGALDLQSASTTIASAATTDIGSVATRRVSISGTTAITSLGTQPNRERLITFTGALTLTYNATSLILPTAANITTAAGDTAYATSDASGNWTVRDYTRASGGPLGQGGSLAASGSFSLSGGLIVKWGSAVVTTDASGNATIAYPSAFPANGFATSIWNGDSNTVPQTLLSTNTSVTGAMQFGIHAHNTSNNTPLASTTIRVNYIAVGN